VRFLPEWAGAQEDAEKTYGRFVEARDRVPTTSISDEDVAEIEPSA
jgi:hypothetical protein